MTIKELKEKLEKFPEDMEVFLADTFEGYGSPVPFKEDIAIENVTIWLGQKPVLKKVVLIGAHMWF